MKDAKNSRRQFVYAGSLSLASVPVVLSACGRSESSGQSSDGDSVAKPVDGKIATNHGHKARLVDENFKFVLDIKGDGTHNHKVELSAKQLADIDSGKKVTVTSTADFGHAHQVVFN